MPHDTAQFERWVGWGCEGDGAAAGRERERRELAEALNGCSKIKF